MQREEEKLGEEGKGGGASKGLPGAQARQSSKQSRAGRAFEAFSRSSGPPMVSLSLGQIAEQAGVRPPGSSSNWKSRSSGEETPGTAAGIASGYARSRVPKILEPAPVTGSASSGSTVGLAAPAPQAERSASATDLYERAIRGAELGGRTHQQHGSDPGML